MTNYSFYVVSRTCDICDRAFLTPPDSAATACHKCNLTIIANSVPQEKEEE